MLNNVIFCPCISFGTVLQHVKSSMLWVSFCSEMWSLRANDKIPPSVTRTRDHKIYSLMLYHLSYQRRVVSNPIRAIRYNFCFSRHLTIHPLRQNTILGAKRTMTQTRSTRFDMDHVDEEAVTSEEPTLKPHKIIIDLNGCRYEVGKHESSILSALCVILQLHH